MSNIGKYTAMGVLAAGLGLSRIRPAGQRMGNQNSYRRRYPEPRSVGQPGNLCLGSPLRTGRLRSPPAFGAVTSRFSIEYFLKLPRLDGRKHPADEFRWNRRQPFGIDEIAFDEVGSSPKPIGGGEQPGMNQRRSADDNDPAIAKQKPPQCHSCT